MDAVKLPAPPQHAVTTAEDAQALANMSSPLQRKYEAMMAKHEADTQERRESVRHTGHLTTERSASLSSLKEIHIAAVEEQVGLSEEEVKLRLRSKWERSSGGEPDDDEPATREPDGAAPAAAATRHDARLIDDDGSPAAAARDGDDGASLIDATVDAEPAAAMTRDDDDSRPPAAAMTRDDDDNGARIDGPADAEPSVRVEEDAVAIADGAAAITAEPSTADSPAKPTGGAPGSPEPVASPDDRGGGLFAAIGGLLDRIDDFAVENLADPLARATGATARSRSQPGPKVVYCAVGIGREVVAETIDPRDATREATGEAIRLGRHMVESRSDPPRTLLGRVLGFGASWDDAACGEFTALKLLESDADGGAACSFVVCFFEGELPMEDAVAFCEEVAAALRPLLRDENDELLATHDAPMLTDMLAAEVCRAGYGVAVSGS